MFNKKTKLKLTDFECNLLINGMNEFRNTLLSDGIPTDDVDEQLLKIIIRLKQKQINIQLKMKWRSLLNLYFENNFPSKSNLFPESCRFYN